MIEASNKDIISINDKMAYTQSKMKTKMLYDNTHLSKVSPLKFLESFLQEYSPKFKNNFVVSS